MFRWRFQYLLRKAYKTYRIVALQGGVITYFARTYLSVLGASSPEVSLGQARSSIELFLLLGANPNSADRDGLTPLHKACMLPTDDAVDVIRTLIAYGADVNMRSRRGRKTPLMCACEFLTPWSVAVVKLLLESGADPSMADSKGNTPLHSLACIGYTFTTLTVADQGQTLPDPRRVFVPEPDKTVKSAKDWKSKLKVKNLALEDAMKEGKNVKTIYPFWIKKAFVEDLLRRLEIKAVELQNQGVEGAGGADEALEIVRGELGGLSFLAFYGDQMDQDDGNMGGGGRADERLWARGE